VEFSYGTLIYVIVYPGLEMSQSLKYGNRPNMSVEPNCISTLKCCSTCMQPVCCFITTTQLS